LLKEKPKQEQECEIQIGHSLRKEAQYFGKYDEFSNIQPDLILSHFNMMQNFSRNFINKRLNGHQYY
jgi:hypothetical protein